MEKRNDRKTRSGFVVSAKMDKSAVVKVERKLKHPVYGKFIKKSKRYHIHDEENTCNAGDFVEIMETRPVSKLKRWRLVSIIEKAK